MYLNTSVETMTANGHPIIDTLSFLKKPSRGRNMKSTFAINRELQKNLELNAVISEDTKAYVLSNEDLLSPKSSSDRSSDAKYNNYINYVDSKLESELDEPIELEEQRKPIYKKSGELLVSSLKKRSMSLPGNVYELNNKKEYKRDFLKGRNRSKSVHFDSCAPVKYFNKNSKPSEVSLLETKMDSVNYTQKRPLHIHTSDEDVEPEVKLDLSQLLISPGSKNDQYPSLKSINKNTSLQCSNEEEQKTSGLYNMNFPILSNKNPKSLKFNIFVSLKDKMCFPQDLTLHVQKRGLNSMIHPNQPQNLLTTFITGRILVKNVFFEKKVVLKYTLNNWNTCHDIQCTYLGDGEGFLPGVNVDIFKFIFDYNQEGSYHSNGKLEFCIQYITKEGDKMIEYWDNNEGQNYKVDVVLNTLIR